MRVVSLFLLLLICTIGTSKASDIPPTARITLDNPARSELIGYTGETLTFSSATSTANCGSITLRLWKLGSGSWTSSMEEFTHTFTLPTGVYEQTHTLQLRVVNSCAGLDDIITKTITIRRDQRTYFVKDHLGSVRATVNEAGDVIGYDDYYPFGLVMPGRSSNTGNPNDDIKFTGYELDDEGGLTIYYAGARMYDPVLGRFMSIDRYYDKYPSMSPYQYAANNPVNFIDVNGDSIDVSRLYSKDEDGNYLYATQAAAFELFASSYEGKAWILERAQKGFKLEGKFVDGLSIEATEEGALSEQGIDAVFKVGDTGVGTGFTEASMKGDRLEVSYYTDVLYGKNKETNLQIFDATATLIHETLIHGSEVEQRFLNNPSQFTFESTGVIDRAFYNRHSQDLIMRLPFGKNNYQIPRSILNHTNRLLRTNFNPNNFLR